MKTKIITAHCLLLLSSCAYVPHTNQTAQRVSEDYLAYGSSGGINAYLYGSHTVIEPSKSPLFLWVYDNNDKSVSYEKVGRYYRLNREMPSFTVWVDGSPVTFYKTKKKSQSILTTPPIQNNMGDVKTSKAIEQPLPSLYNRWQAETEQAKISDLVALTNKQIDEVKTFLDAYGNDNITAWNRARLYFQESRLTTESTATVRLQYESKNATNLQIKGSTSNTLIAAAKVAYLINIRGRTDSYRSNKYQRQIALKRAIIARDYLIDNGVPPGIINVYAKSKGDFVAPNNAAAGRTLNRRVEIEIMHPYIAFASSNRKP